jgi:hypothetical protein
MQLIAPGLGEDVFAVLEKCPELQRLALRRFYLK